MKTQEKTANQIIAITRKQLRIIKSVSAFQFKGENVNLIPTTISSYIFQFENMIQSGKLTADEHIEIEKLLKEYRSALITFKKNQSQFNS